MTYLIAVAKKCSAANVLNGNVLSIECERCVDVYCTFAHTVVHYLDGFSCKVLNFTSAIKI